MSNAFAIFCLNTSIDYYFIKVSDGVCGTSMHAEKHYLCDMFNISNNDTSNAIISCQSILSISKLNKMCLFV